MAEVPKETELYIQHFSAGVARVLGDLAEALAAQVGANGDAFLEDFMRRLPPTAAQPSQALFDSIRKYLSERPLAAQQRPLN